MEHDEELLRNAPPATLDTPVCRALDRAVELRADAEGNDIGTMVGEFSVFNDWYEINSFWEGRFLERIAPGAFKRTINNRSGQSPVRVLLEHGYDPSVGDKPLGVPTTLDERSTGVYAETPLLDTSYCRDLAPALAAGAYGQSFRFRVMVDEWVEEPERSEHNPDGLPERTIKEVRLIEFGPTVFPASPSTNASTGLRSTTDQFYASLRRRDPAAYDDALARTQQRRLPATPAVTPEAPTAASAEDRQAQLDDLGETGETQTTAPSASPDDTARTTPSNNPEDTTSRHSEDPQGQPPERADEHSQDPPVTRSADPTLTAPSNTTRSNTVDETMTVEERATRKSEIRARLTEINSEYDGATLPAEIQTEWDSLRNEFADHTAAIEASETRRAQLAEVDPEDDTRTERPTSRPRTPGAPTSPKRRTGSIENLHDLAEYRQIARSIDELPELYRDGAMRVVERSKFPGVEDRTAAQAAVERVLAKVDDARGTLAQRILTTGAPAYERAFSKYCISQTAAACTLEEQRALALGAGSTGGFAVPFQLDPTIILTSNGSSNPLRRIARVEQIVGKEWDGVTSAGVTVSRAAEAAEAADGAPTLAQPTVKAERVHGFVPFSVEVEQDWNQLQSEMTRLLADAKDTEEAASFITGTGVSPEANGLITTLNSSSNVTANTFTVGALYSLEDALPERFLDNASFLGHRSVFNLVRQFDTSGGASLWVRLGDGLPPELIGYPAYRTSAMPDGTLSVADRYLVLGDFKQFLIVDRVGMMVDVLPHLLGSNRRPTGQRGIYAMWRNNSKVLVDNAFRVLHKAA